MEKNNSKPTIYKAIHILASSGLCTSLEVWPGLIEFEGETGPGCLCLNRPEPRPEDERVELKFNTKKEAEDAWFLLSLAKFQPTKISEVGFYDDLYEDLDDIFYGFKIKTVPVDKIEFKKVKGVASDLVRFLN